MRSEAKDNNILSDTKRLPIKKQSKNFDINRTERIFVFKYNPIN